MPSVPHRRICRRRLLTGAAAVAIGGLLRPGASRADSTDSSQIAARTLNFIRQCARDDGGYAPSPDTSYPGNSDTGLSDLAAVTYAAVLAATMGWALPHPEKSVAFVQMHQQKDGRFVNLAGKMNPNDPLAVLYNTTQAVVALHALESEPKIDPAPALREFFHDGAYRKLPWYTTSFFPLFYAALHRPFPAEQKDALAAYLTSAQKEDGYIQDHVAATFHAAHFFRLIGKPTPRSSEMVDRTLHDQTKPGGWDIKDPDWDVHACFDALFILRQLGGGEPRVREAVRRAGQWAGQCQNDDGGFGHYPGKHSDMDALYFNFGSLIQAGIVPIPRPDRPDAHMLGWGHAMQPGRIYVREN